MKPLLFGTLMLLLCTRCFGQPPVYDIQIEIVPHSKQMLIRGTMTIPGQSQSQEQIQVALSELMHDFNVHVIAPVQDEKPEITNKLRAWGREGWGQNTWNIKPRSPIPANSPVVLGFQYRYSGDKAGFVLSASQRCFFASGINSAWYPQVEEHPRTDDGIRLRGLRSTGKILFRLPHGWKVYCPGKQHTVHDATEFTMDQPVFFSFAAGPYEVSAIQDPMNVALYQLQSRGERMKSYLTSTARILEVLSNEFGRYRFPQFAIAEVPADEGNAAGFAGASLDGFMLATTDFLNQEFNTAYYGHEIGHQWWGNLVRTEGSEARWLLSEAMAQYGSLRSVELLEGPRKAEAYRRKGYAGYIQDQSGFGYLMLSAAGVDVPLTKLPADGALSRWLADSKGFFVFDMLAREMGRDQFSKALKSITEEYDNRRISWNDFQTQVQKFSDRDLSWFFHQWFDQTGLPEWTQEWRRRNGRNVWLRVVQKPPHFQFHVSVKLRGKDQEVLHEIFVERARQEFEWDVPFDVVDVELNPNFDLLAWTDSYKKEASALAVYTRAALQGNDGNMEKARGLFEQGLRNLPSPDPYGVTFRMHYGFAVLLFEQNELDRSRKHLEVALQSPVKQPERLPWAYLRLAEIADKQNDPSLVCSSVRSLNAADQAAPSRTGAMEHARELIQKHRCEIHFR